MLAAVVEHVELFGIEVESRFPVTDKSVVVPGIPQPGDNRGEFPRTLIAIGVADVPFEIEVESFGFGARRHQVPAGAAVAQQIEGRELARDVERLIECRAGGRNKADPVGDGRQRRQQRQRLEGDRTRGVAQRIDVAVANPDAIGEENRIEFGKLGEPETLAKSAFRFRLMNLALAVRSSPDAGRRHLEARYSAVDLSADAGAGIACAPAATFAGIVAARPSRDAGCPNMAISATNTKAATHAIRLKTDARAS